MDLVHDLLDEQLVDRNNRAMGKVDGVVLEVERGRPPRVVAIEVGAVTLARRLHPALARWVVAWTRRLGVGSGEPLRVPVGKIRKEDINLKADVDVRQTPAFAWERWLRDHVVGRIPGSGL